MIKIAFVNAKGGVGKTTCALLVAAALKNAGQTVALDDRDPYKSATLAAEALNLTLGDNADVVIIDTPPNIHTAETIDAITTASLVVLVTTPSPPDLARTAITAERVKKLRSGPTQLLFNLVQTNNRYFESMPEIAKQIPFPVFKNYLVQRTIYKTALHEGWAAIPFRFREEIVNVASEIALALSK